MSLNLKIFKDKTKRTVGGDLRSLIDDEVTSDLALHAEGAVVLAHKAILAARSPYFRSLLFGAFKEARDGSFLRLSSALLCPCLTLQQP